MAGLEVKLTLGRTTYVPGDTVRGTVQLTVGKDAVRVEAMRLQLHGHLRIEPRWLPLPAPLRDVYNQKPPPSAPTGDELVPRFVGFEGVNAACIFTTPPVRLLPLTSESRVFAHAAEGDGTLPALPAGSLLRWAFRVALPSSGGGMLPSFRGLAARVVYVVTVATRLAPASTGATAATPVSPRPSSSTTFGWLGMGRDSRDRGTSTPGTPSRAAETAQQDLHLSFSVLSPGQEASTWADRSDGAPPLAVKHVGFASIEIDEPVDALGAGPAPFGALGDTFIEGVAQQMPRLTVMPWDLSGRRAHAMEVIAHEEKMTNAHAERHAAQRVITLELEQARLLRCHIAASEPEDAQSFLATSGAGDGDANHGALAEEDDSDDAPPPPMPTVLSISHGDLALVRVTLCRTQYAPGEGVLVTFDFSGAERLCRLLTVSLHTRERYRGHALGGSSAESLGDGGGEIAHETLVTSCQRDIDLSNPEEQREKVSSLLWIPAEATLSFTTSIIKMEWLLKFEFVTVPRDHGGNSGDLDDTVEMSLPIEVIAPQNVGECDLWEDTVARRLRLQ